MEDFFIGTICLEIDIRNSVGEVSSKKKILTFDSVALSKIQNSNLIYPRRVFTTFGEKYVPRVE